MKKAIYNLVDKAVLLSYYSFHNKNLDLIKSDLIKNNYPLPFIKKHMKKRLCKNFDDRNIANISENFSEESFVDSVKNIFICLTYVST